MSATFKNDVVDTAVHTFCMYAAMREVHGRQQARNSINIQMFTFRYTCPVCKLDIVKLLQTM